MTIEHTLEGLDGARRAGWAKFYAAEAAANELADDVNWYADRAEFWRTQASLLAGVWVQQIGGGIVAADWPGWDLDAIRRGARWQATKEGELA